MAQPVFPSAPQAKLSLGDAQSFAHRYIETQDAFRLIALPREDHAAMPFLIDDHLGPRPAMDIPARQIEAIPVEGPMAGPMGGGLHFLFHSAFCGSTMLVRALSHAGVAMGLSEPVLFNDVVGFRRRGASGAAVARVADLSMRLLARPFGPGEAVIVKPSNIINPLAHLLMAMRPQAKAVFLYAPLETFLLSVARKGLHCRLWARELMAGYRREGVIGLGLDPEQHFHLSDLQVAAVGWLAQHQLFHALDARCRDAQGKPRLVWLDADRLNRQPQAALSACLDHYGLHPDPAMRQAMLDSPAFARHSKSGQAYSPAAREADYAASRAAYGEEIAMVVQWAQALAQSNGIRLEGGSPLLAADSEVG